ADKPEQLEGVLADHGAHPHPDRLPHRREPGQGEHRERHAVPHTGHLDDGLALGLLEHGSVQRGDHGRMTAGRSRVLRSGAARRARRARNGEPARGRGQPPTGAGPVAPAGGPPASPRKPVTARATASFAAAPPAPMERFTIAGAYSNTGTPARAATSSATPRAWPRTSALRAF